MSQFGYREKINLLAWLLATGEANSENASAVFQEHYRLAKYDYKTDQITVNNGTKIDCTPCHKLLDNVVWPAIPNAKLVTFIGEYPRGRSPNIRPNTHPIPYVSTF